MHEEQQQGPMTDERTAAEAGSTAGGDVLSLIADVERHLDRIRNVQNRQESEFADLAERQRRVAQTESSLGDRRAELDALASRLGEAQAANEAARAAVAQERDELEAREASFRAEVDALSETRSELDGMRETLAARARELDEQAAIVDRQDAALQAQAESLATREQEFVARVEAADAARVEAESALARATESMEARQAEFDALNDRLAGLISAQEAGTRALEEAVAARDEALATIRSTVERHEQEMATASEATQRYRAALEDVGTQLEQSQSETESVRAEGREAVARLEERCAEVEKALVERDTAFAGVQSSVARLEAEIAEREARIAEQQRAFVEVEARAEAADASMTEARSRIAELEARTQEDQRQLRLAGTKLAELAQVVAEQAPRLERGGEAMALVGELEAEIERLRSQAADASGFDVDAIRAPLDARIIELERELQAARSQAFDPSSLDVVISEATAPFVARITDLESALEASRRSGSEVDPEAFAAAVADAKAPLEARIAELESAAHSGDPAAIDAAVQAATETLRAELDEARQAADGDSVPRSKYEDLKEKCRRAERRSDELETALSLTNDRGQAQEMAKRLRAKAERVGDFAKHLERRKARLAALRTAMRQREAMENVGGGTTFHELQRLEAQRRELEQVRDFLTRSEQQMVRRWARPRSVATVAWMMVILAVSVAAGWVGGTRFVPTPGAATVSLTAAAVSGKTLDPDAAKAWEDWHTALATDPAFVSLVAKRLSARGLMPAGGESALASLLAQDLAFENEGHGRLRLVLSGEDARTLEPVLDAVATTMASESARQAPRRIDGARATLPTERATAGGLGYATLVAGPYGPDALTRMGMIAGGVFAGCTLFVLLVYGVLSRSKRVFEANADGEDASSMA
jgi:chromosome segregation ATPase